MGYALDLVVAPLTRYKDTTLPRHSAIITTINAAKIQAKKA